MSFATKKTALASAAILGAALTLTGASAANAVEDRMPSNPTCESAEELVPVDAINVGGPEVTVAGKTWRADTMGTGGHTWTNPSEADIAGTDADVLYRSERAGRTIHYRIPVDKDGHYLVRLHMAEIWWDAPEGSGLPGRKQHPGKRVESFNVEGGHTELNNVNLAQVAGGSMEAITADLHTWVKDNSLSIKGHAKVDMAQLGAIEVFKIEPTGCAIAAQQ